MPGQGCHLQTPPRWKQSWDPPLLPLPPLFLSPAHALPGRLPASLTVPRPLLLSFSYPQHPLQCLLLATWCPLSVFQSFFLSLPTLVECVCVCVCACTRTCDLWAQGCWFEEAQLLCSHFKTAAQDILIKRALGDFLELCSPRCGL